MMGSSSSGGIAGGNHENVQEVQKLISKSASNPHHKPTTSQFSSKKLKRGQKVIRKSKKNKKSFPESENLSLHTNEDEASTSEERLQAVEKRLKYDFTN